MRSPTKAATILITLCVLLPRSSLCQELKPVGQATMTFLRIDPVARSVGLGGASVVLDNDANALFHNPAGIAKVSGGAVCLNNAQWLADMKQYAVAVGYGFPTVGTFAASFMLMDNGEMARTVPDGSRQGYHEEGMFEVAQFAVGLAYARQITDRFSVGGQVKYAYQDLGPTDIRMQIGTQAFDTLRNVKNAAGVFALDFGTIYYPGFKDLRIAMSFQNFSTKVRYAYDYFQLPVALRVGIAMNALAVVTENSDHSLLVSIEVAHPNDYSDRVCFGGEYSFRGILSLRAGYRVNYDEGAFCAGIGLSGAALGANMRLDYAYTHFGEVLGAVHRLSLGFSF